MQNPTKAGDAHSFSSIVVTHISNAIQLSTPLLDISVLVRRECGFDIDAGDQPIGPDLQSTAIEVHECCNGGLHRQRPFTLDDKVFQTDFMQERIGRAVVNARSDLLPDVAGKPEMLYANFGTMGGGKLIATCSPETDSCPAQPSRSNSQNVRKERDYEIGYFGIAEKFSKPTRAFLLCMVCFVVSWIFLSYAVAGRRSRTGSAAFAILSTLCVLIGL
jgi:hypothetical protein